VINLSLLPVSLRYVPATLSLRALGVEGAPGGEESDASLWIDVSSNDAAYDGVAPPPMQLIALPSKGHAPLCTAGGDGEDEDGMGGTAVL